MFTMSSSKPFLLFLIIFISLHYFSVANVEYDVGDTKGWFVPPANDSTFYNEWASEKRFLIGDTIRFKYEKDSVMVVTDVEYNECNSTHPIYFSNNGNSVFTFNRSGLFYFISGVSGHCERGEKMIIKVMALEETPPASGGSDNSPAKSDAASKHSNAAALIIFPFVLALLFGSSSILF